MTQFNLALDEFLRQAFWRAYDLGIFAGIMLAATVYIFWVVLEHQNFSPHQRLWAYILSVTFMADTAAILWTWGMGWGWFAIAALAPPLCVILYFTPTVAAIYWQHPSFNSIFVVNLITGWTVIGWMLAFLWAQRSPWRNTQFNIDARLTPSPELAASLREPDATSHDQVEAVRNLLRRRS